MIRLYGYWSTNPQKVRLALEELELPYEWVDVDLSKRQQRTPEYKALNPRAKVPALVDGDLVLWESNAILEYLAEKTGRLQPADPTDRARMRQWLHMESAAFQDPAGEFFFDRVIAPRLGLARTPDDVEKARPRLDRALGVLQDRLVDRDWLCGELTVADLSFGAWLPVLDLDAFPAVAAWRDRIRARPSWARCGITY